MRCEGAPARRSSRLGLGGLDMVISSEGVRSEARWLDLSTVFVVRDGLFNAQEGREGFHAFEETMVTSDTRHHTPDTSRCER